MMPPRQFLALWQELIQMAAPARRVLSTAQPLRLSCIENALDPAAEPGSGLRLAAPERFENREDVVSGDLISRETT